MPEAGEAADTAREARITAWLTEAMSRGAVKRAAAELDADPDLRRRLLTRASHLPPEAASWPAKKLLRRARARDQAARIRTNPIARDEAFTCAHCGADVPAHGRTARDHCPHCLRSLHVDVIPGDRAARCGGILDPVGVEPLGGGEWRLIYRCRRCDAVRHNRVLRDGEPPDDWSVVVELAGAGAGG